MAEPYSLTALMVWIQARVSLGKKFTFILFGLQNIYKPFNKFLAWIQQFLFKRVDAIAVCGPEQEEVLRKQGYSGKIIDFPLWYDSSIFKPLEKKNIDQEKIHFLSKNQKRDKVRLGYVGALVEQKGIRNLMQALSSNSSQFSEKSEVYIVGRGQLDQELSECIQKLNKKESWIHQVGFLQHRVLPIFFNSIDVLIVPSLTKSHWKEQFGRIIIEAQACGCLVIGSDSGHIPELIDDEFCFSENSLGELLRCINIAIEKVSKNRTGFRSAQIAKASKYSDETLAHEFQNNLKNLTDDKKS